ncbi:MAG: class I SAM-dependent methyltransferase [Bdellovibrionota bacterium]
MNSKKDWAIKIFNKSPLKQRKYNVIKSLLGDYSNKTCLDIGSDNGVISYCLRREGGTWYSADLIQETVNLIKELVETNVFEVNDEEKFPFENEMFDVVVIVDFLEHIHDDKFVIEELSRILKKGGQLIINAPNPVNGVVRFLKFKTGQTDEAHGHVRAGYNLKEIKDLTLNDFEIISFKKYARCFSDFIDFLIIFALRKLQKNRDTKKGTVVSGDDLNKFKKSFKLYSLIYPLLKLFVYLDALFFFLPANMLTVKLRKK